MRVFKSIMLFFLVFCTLAVTVVCAAVVGGDYANNSKITVDSAQSEAETTAQVKAVLRSASDIAKADKHEKDDNSAKQKDKKTEYTPRLLAPEGSNEYYYSDKNVFYESGWAMPNCTAYAWGRAYEILGDKPNLSINDANEWYDYNKQEGNYAYGQEPKPGAIACFSYTDRDSGHVAVVEKITDDKIYLSNSAWEGSEFYVDVCDVEDPTAGRENWLFQGYIYILD